MWIALYLLTNDVSGNVTLQGNSFYKWEGEYHNAALKKKIAITVCIVLLHQFETNPSIPIKMRPFPFESACIGA